MTSAELLESLDRHFIAGCPALSTSQLKQHEATGTCPECSQRASAAAVASDFRQMHDLADQVTSRIPDAEVDVRLRDVLRRAGYEATS